jgi:hypothetical protein
VGTKKRPAPKAPTALLRRSDVLAEGPPNVRLIEVLDDRSGDRDADDRVREPVAEQHVGHNLDDLGEKARPRSRGSGAVTMDAPRPP